MLAQTNQQICCLGNKLEKLNLLPKSQNPHLTKKIGEYYNNFSL